MNQLPPSGPGGFFRLGAPEHDYTLQGCVVDARTRRPVPALVEVWHAVTLPDGRCGYSQAPSWAGRWSFHAAGPFRLRSPVPCTYGDQPTHVHLRISAPGYRSYITRVHPQSGAVECGLVPLERE